SNDRRFLLSRFAGGDWAVAGCAVGWRDMAALRGGRGRVSRLKPARGRDRLRRRAAQHRARRRLFPVELSGGARTRLTAEASSEARRSPQTFFACRATHCRRLQLVNVNKAFDSIEIYQHRKTLDSS